MSDRLAAANQVQPNRTRHLNWHNNRRAGTLRQNLSRSHKPLPMPGQLLTNPSSELNQSRQDSQILAREMDGTLHKATRPRADLQTRAPSTDNGRGDTKGIRTTSTLANPGRPSTARFLTYSAPSPPHLFKPKTPARLCRRRNSGGGPAVDDLTPHLIAAQPIDLDVFATLLHFPQCRNTSPRRQCKFTLKKNFRPAHTPPLVDDHLEICRYIPPERHCMPQKRRDTPQC